MSLLNRLRTQPVRIQPAEPSICMDCGIDLPSTWHWDGCRAGVRPASPSFQPEQEEVCPDCKGSVTILKGKRIAYHWDGCAHA